MSVKVYTYDDPKGWHTHPRYGEIKGAIHVCATKNVADGIKQAYQQKDSFERIYTIREIITAMQPDWSSAETQLRQYLKLSKVLKEHVARSEDENIKESFRKNKKEVLDTLRLLAYSGIGPSDLTEILMSREEQDLYLSTKERMLIEVWHELEEKDASYSCIRKEMQTGWSSERLLRALGFNSIPLIDLSRRKLVLHGFYFITPEQQRFLECVREGGMEIVFFNLYDARYPDTFDFTRAFITERYGWSDEWEINSRPNSESGMGDVFLRAYEEGSAPKNEINREVIAYDSFLEFMNKVIVPAYPIGGESPVKSNTQIIATNADMLNDILGQYYPDMVSGNRNILHYPVGQFLSNIHAIRTADGFLLNSDILMATFTSGWLYDPKSGKNARDYTGQLRKILPYFEGCSTLDEWQKRSDELSELYEQILYPYEKSSDGRVLKSMRSPFVRISQFSLDRHEMETIRFFLRQLDLISKELFHIEMEEEQIGIHFKKVFDMVEKYYPDTHVVFEEEEIRILKTLKERLGQIEDDTHFLYEDVGEAVNLYLSGKLDPQDAEIVKPFIEVDGEAFKEGKEYYVTGLDERGLPLSEFSIPWPFQPEIYEMLSERYQVLELNTLRNKSIKQISRYLFYITLEFLQPLSTELSFMRNYLDKKDMEPALYVKQLDLTIIPADVSYDSADASEYRENAYDFEREVTIESLGFEELTISDFLMEYVLCPRRFQYGYVLSEFPTFDTDFHQQFLYTNLLRVVKPTIDDEEKTLQMVGALFPGWTDYRKRMIAKKFIFGKKIYEKTKKDVKDGVKINSARQDFQLPGFKSDQKGRLREKLNGKVPSVISKIKKNLVEDNVFKTKPSKECMYCPYQDICPDGNMLEGDEYL